MTDRLEGIRKRLERERMLGIPGGYLSRAQIDAQIDARKRVRDHLVEDDIPYLLSLVDEMQSVLSRRCETCRWWERPQVTASRSWCPNIGKLTHSRFSCADWEAKQ